MKIEVDVYDNYNRPDSVAEPGGGPRLTESAGYMPVRVQVEQMILAGQALGEYRKEKYDFDNEKDVPTDVLPDPTRSPSFDLADGSMSLPPLVASLKEQHAAARAALQAKLDAIPPSSDDEKPAPKGV